MAENRKLLGKNKVCVRLQFYKKIKNWEFPEKMKAYLVVF